jgi:fibronectin-binding autotransporter adhesin
MFHIRSRIILSAAGAFLACAPMADAQSTWTGGGADANWSTAANWAGGIVPVSSVDTAVTFAGTTNLAPNQNLANPFILNSLMFASGAGNFTLGGNGLDFHTNSASVPPAMTINGNQAINTPLSLSNNLTIATQGLAGSASTIGGAITGPAGLTYTGAPARLSLTGADTYSGPTTIAGQALGGLSTGSVTSLFSMDLTGANGAAANSSGVTINYGTLILDNSSVVKNARIGNVPVALANGTIELVAATSAGATVQSYGNLVLSPGSNGVIVAGGTTNGGATLASTGAIVRSPGALVAFTGPNLGAAPGGVNTGTITFATPPALVGGGGLAGTPTLSIIPYAVAGLTNQPYDLATYGANGVRPLTSSEYASLTNGSSTLNNVAVSTAVTGINSPTTVNALKMTTSGSISGTGTITINSGTVLAVSPSGGHVLTISGGTLAFGAAEAIFRINDSLTVSSTITGSGGLTVDGPVAFSNPTVPLTLSGNNQFSGPVWVHSVLAVTQDASLGASADVINLSGTGTLEAAGPSMSTARTITLNGGGDLAAASGVTLTVTSPIGGTGPLVIGSPTGTVQLTSTTNSYTGGTIISGGTLNISSESVLPSGPLTISSGTLQAGAPLTISRPIAIGGTIDTNGFNVTLSGALTAGNTGVSSFAGTLIKVGNGTLTLTGNNTYAAETQIEMGVISVAADANLGAVTASLILAGGTLQSTASFSTSRTVTAQSGTSSTIDTDGQTLTLTGTVNGQGTITKIGAGSLALAGTINYGGTVIVSAGLLGLASDPTSAALTFNGGGLQALASFASNRSYSFPTTFLVDTNGFNLALAGPLSGVGGLTKLGAGTLTLSGANTYTGPTTVTAGQLTIASQGSTAGFTVGNGATLLFTSGYNLGFQAIQPAAGGSVNYNGATITGGYLYGPGTHSILANGATFVGTTSYAGAVINQNGPATFMSFSNGGALNLTSGATLTGFTNQGSGAITVAAASEVNVAAFQTYGTMTINPAVVGSGQFTEVVNTGASPMYFNGGSRTFIGTPATAGPPNAPTFVAGIDLNGQNAVVAGGLFVNNGFVVDSSNGAAGTATIVADFGSLVKGAGYFQNPIITQNGGKVQAGNSPGSASFGKFVFGPGGVNNYVFAIDDATGAAGPTADALGHVSGWGLINAMKQAVGSVTASGDFVWTATPSAKLTVAIDTLINPTTVGTDVAGLMADFDPNQSYSWPAARWAGTYSGPTDVAMLDAATSFDTSGFLNPIAGTFGWSLSGSSLSLSYTPSAVPEPGTLALTMVAACGTIAAWGRRWRCGRPTAAEVLPNEE